MLSMSPHEIPSWHPGTLAQLACILEATFRKPGNVHPGRSFEDTSYLDFVLSAAAAAPALDLAASRPLGETILEAVQATHTIVGKNTNLGIVLSLAPLCALPAPVLRAGVTDAGRTALEAAIRKLLSSLTHRDADLAYEAIRLAAPGGLGKAAEGDVGGPPAGTLLEMMWLASNRDLIALQYTNGFREVIHEGLPGIASALRAGRTLEEAAILCHLGLMARHGDSLIARKCGEEASREASHRAKTVLDAGWPTGESSAAVLDGFDLWLRAGGNRRNPGACADLLSAVLFLGLASGIICLPLAPPKSLHG